MGSAPQAMLRGPLAAGRGGGQQGGREHAPDGSLLHLLHTRFRFRFGRLTCPSPHVPLLVHDTHFGSSWSELLVGRVTLLGGVQSMGHGGLGCGC